MERKVGYSSFWNGKNGPEIHRHSKPYAFEDGRLHPSHRLERLDVEVFGSDPIAIVEGIHGDEPVHFMHKQILENKFHGIYIKYANLLAEKLGRRGYVYPPGIEIDLNRQFYLPEDKKTWGDVFKSTNEWTISFFAMLKEFGYVKHWFFIHKDLDLGEPEGGYSYFSLYSAKENHDYDLIKKSTENLSKSARAKGFRLYTGFPDKNDPRVNHWADDGLVYQPLIGSDDIRREDGSLEQCIVILSRLGLIENNVSTSTIEIPGHLNKEREEEITKIFVDELIIKFSKAKDFWR